MFEEQARNMTFTLENQDSITFLDSIWNMLSVAFQFLMLSNLIVEKTLFIYKKRETKFCGNPGI